MMESENSVAQHHEESGRPTRRAGNLAIVLLAIVCVVGIGVLVTLNHYLPGVVYHWNDLELTRSEVISTYTSAPSYLLDLYEPDRWKRIRKDGLDNEYTKVMDYMGREFAREVKRELETEVPTVALFDDAYITNYLNSPRGKAHIREMIVHDEMEHEIASRIVSDEEITADDRAGWVERIRGVHTPLGPPPTDDYVAMVIINIRNDILQPWDGYTRTADDYAPKTEAECGAYVRSNIRPALKVLQRQIRLCDRYSFADKDWAMDVITDLWNDTSELTRAAGSPATLTPAEVRLILWALDRDVLIALVLEHDIVITTSAVSSRVGTRNIGNTEISIEADKVTKTRWILNDDWLDSYGMSDTPSLDAAIEQLGLVGGITTRNEVSR